jgi:hypothetical protein
MISLQTQEEKKKAEKKQNQANIIRNKSPSSIIDVDKCYETMHVTFVDDDVNCDDQLAPPLR